MKKFVPSKVTKEECQQMVAMMNWMDSQEEIYAYQIRSFKQYNSKDKHYHTMFNLVVQKWENGKHRHVQSVGKTLIEAMENLVL